MTYKQAECTGDANMNDFIHHIYNVIVKFDLSDRQTWLVLYAVAIVIGFFCLRGYGSRSSY